jgi:hypothetical protein
LSFPLYLDEDSMHRRLAVPLRAAGHDVLTTTDARNEGLDDEAQVAFAAAAQRVLVTANQADYARLHHRWSAAGKHHAGLIVITEQRAKPELLLAKLLRLQSLRSASDMTDGILYINGDISQELR